MPLEFVGRCVVMGVSGSGKSAIGAGMAERLGCVYLDGDRYHPRANIDKMERGEPLTDEDRAGWLDVLAQLIRDYRDDEMTVLIGCSALKRAYRDRLREGDANLSFVYLHGSYEVILGRMQQREHFFSPAMLQSQFDTLEIPGPDEAHRIDIDAGIDSVVDRSVEALRAEPA